MEKIDQKTAQLDKRIREMPYKIESSAKYVKSRLKEMTPDEQPFNQVDNKYYYVVWQGNKNLEWKICKFKNTEKIRLKGGSKLVLDYYGRVHDPNKINLVFDAKIINLRANDQIWTDNSINFKAVYRWNGGEEWSPILKYDGGMIKFWVWKDFKTWDKTQRGIVTTAAIGLRTFGYWLIW
ncbi:hypothetical protein C6B38_01395 [Spiroplasma sp. ChiS]|uniref:hypothetical protein n=1 Tax=Spiroplasma sp. ChiS TaxID=2099885 RepID=UPI000CFA5781|nr:hypothetical protein [Spiroplasma sp. ChiS]PQP79389.1 hypothetical protein C6B38_01395 [Spiroplasma sp. ChiS]